MCSMSYIQYILEIKDHSGVSGTTLKIAYINLLKKTQFSGM